MGQTPQPPTTFPRHGKIRKRMAPITMEQALAEASEAGYQPTAKSRPGMAHLQRKWNEGATVKEVPGGVVVAPAWTPGQLYVVLAVAAAFFLLVICPMGSGLFVA